MQQNFNDLYFGTFRADQIRDGDYAVLLLLPRSGCKFLGVCHVSVTAELFE